MVVVSIDEDTLEVSLQVELFPQFLVEFSRPKLFCNLRIGGPSDPLSFVSVVPVGGLEDGVVPEFMTKHFLEQPNHGPESIGHPVVGLFEGDDEDMNIFNFIPEGGHQTFDSFLLLHQFIPKARSINDGEHLSRGVCVSQPVALVSTGPLGDAVQACAHFKTAISKVSPVVVLIPSNQDIGQTGLAHSCSPEDDDPGTWKFVLVVVAWYLTCS